MAATATIEISNITSSSINVVVTAYSTSNTTGPWYLNITTNNGMGGSPTYADHPVGGGSWYSPDTIPVVGKTYTVLFSTLRYDQNNPNTAFDATDALGKMYYSPFNLFIYKNGGVNSNPGTFILTSPHVTQITAGGGGGSVACFMAGSKILTPYGYVAVEDIYDNDIVLTADARPVPVNVFKTTVMTTKETAPYFIPKSVFGLQQDLYLSPWHAFQIRKGVWMKPQTASELYDSVLQYDVGKLVTYYHLEAPNYFKDNLVCNGVIVESFSGNQLVGMKGRMYTYNSKLKGYTRAASKRLALIN